MPTPKFRAAMASSTSRSRSLQTLSGVFSQQAVNAHVTSAPTRYPQSRPVRNSEDFFQCRPSTSNEILTPLVEQQNVAVSFLSPPPLLLEGDTFCISRDGVTRTYYELDVSSSIRHSIRNPFAVEEHYDLERASKRFVLRKNVPSVTPIHPRCEKEDLARLGDPMLSFELKEIDHGVLGSAGTGSTTWESSIVMAMFFSMHPELLFGDVIELGSGVGFGGIMSHIHRPPEMKSFTMTDYKAEVINQCRDNIGRVRQSHGRVVGPRLHVRKLNWHDFAEKGGRTAVVGSYEASYDTVVASDCAYLFSDLVALSQTMKKLLRQDKKSSVHIFGPYNRSALRELITLLRNDRKMIIVVEEIDMNRYRLKDRGGTITVQRGCEVCEFASKNVATFLHITASLPDGDESETNKEGIMDEID